MHMYSNIQCNKMSEHPNLDRTNDDIRVAVELWFSDNQRCLMLYGHMEDWNVSKVTCMKRLFQYRRDFNDNLSGWDVSHVTDMSFMFCGATAFNQDLSGWDVSRVENMSSMFNNATAFNQDLSGWDVSQV